ncbi:MAG: selenide, water dikinase SelD, partial [Acidimicrobiia bacterium]
ACKLAPSELAQVLRRLGKLAVTRHEDLLVGLSGHDDAGVFRVAADTALVQTVDFFTPIVDEPYDWGRITAANALSDVYAMGGRPLTALQMVGWPREELPFDLLDEVLEGGAAVLEEAGCVLVGGHSVDDPEPKYGFAVTGLVHPDRVVTTAGARPGDVLVLTKPLGTGVISTGIKRDRTDPAVRDGAVQVMVTLNAGAARAMLEAGASAATDVTGYGLLGHLREMLLASGRAATVSWKDVPLLPGAGELAEARVVPGGTKRNLADAERYTDFDGLIAHHRVLLADAQTSGGLLIAVAADRRDALLAALDREGVPARAVIGEVVEGVPGSIRVQA